MQASAGSILVTPTAGLTTTEGGERAMFTIVLGSMPTANVTIGISSSDTSEGRVAPPTLAFTRTNWNAPQTVTITGVDDSDADGDVAYTIVTSPSVSADPDYLGIDANDVSVTNTDDESAGVTVTPVSGLTTSEGGSSATFSVVLHSEPSADVTVPITSSTTSEATVAPLSLTFTPTDWSAPQTVTITGVDDADLDGAQAFTILLGSCTSTDLNYNGFDPDDVSGTNLDDESGGILVTPVTGLSTSEGGASATFSIQLISAPGSDVMVPIASSDVSEGTLDAASIVFTAANWNVPRVVTVTGVDDGVSDGDQPYSIHVGASVSADLQYNGLLGSDVAVINIDDDMPGVLVTPTLGLITTEAGDAATFTVVLRSRPDFDVTFSVTSSDLGEGDVAPSTLTFTTLNWNTPQTVTVTGADDAIADGDQTYDAVVHVSASADTDYAALTDEVVEITNVDDETPSIIVSPTSGLTTTELGGTATFTIRLGSAPSASVLINLSSDTTAEGTVAPALVSFTSGNWNVPRTITVTGVNDAVDDGDRLFHIVTGAAVSADTNYSMLDASDVAVTNTDDDSAGVVVTPTTGLVTTELGASASFSIVLSSQPTGSVTIAVTSSNTNEGTVSPDFITFTTFNWNTLRTVTVTGVDDSIADGTIAYSVVNAVPATADMVYAAIDPADVSVTNTDNDMASVIVTPTSGLTTYEGSALTDSFTIVLNSQPTADVTVSLTSSNVLEGSVSPASVTFTSLDWNSPRFVGVTGVDDFVMDGNISYTVVTSAASSTDPVYNTLPVADVSVTNIDNDAIGISVSPIAGLFTTETGETATFMIRLNTMPSASVTIGLTSNNVGEGTVSPASVTFTTLNWNTGQVVTITGVDDLLPDGNAMYSIVTAPAVSADPSYNTLNAVDVSVTNVDDDIASVIVSPSAGLVTSESGQSASFTVVLGRAPTSNVTISLTSSVPGEGSLLSSSLTFTTGNWNVPQTVMVLGVDDYLRDGTRGYSILTGACSSSDPVYSGFAVDDVNLMNTDNEVAVIYTGYLPTAIELAGTNAWVTNYFAHSVSRINMGSNTVTANTVVGAGAQALASDGTRLWVAAADVARVDIVDLASAALIGNKATGSGPVSTIYAASSIWVANTTDNTVTRVDPSSTAITATIPVTDPRSLGADATNIWAATGQGAGTLVKIDIATNAVVATTPIGSTPTSPVVAAGSVWVSRSTSNSVVRVNPTTGVITATITVGAGPYGMAFDGTRMWVAVSGTNTLVAIDPGTNAVTRSLVTGGTPIDLAWDGSDLWVVTYGNNGVTRIHP